MPPGEQAESYPRERRSNRGPNCSGPEKQIQESEGRQGGACQVLQQLSSELEILPRHRAGEDEGALQPLSS